MAEPERATKHDAGKPRMDLIDPYAIGELAKVLEFGSRKYAAWDWAKGMEYSRLQGAALRHLFAFQGGENLDPETGLPHLAHALCCVMFLLGMTQRHPEMDDRCPLPSKLNPLRAGDGDRRFMVPLDMPEHLRSAAAEAQAEELLRPSGLHPEARRGSPREDELERVLFWVMGYELEVEGLPEFSEACQAGPGRYAWRAALADKLRKLGVPLAVPHTGRD